MTIRAQTGEGVEPRDDRLPLPERSDIQAHAWFAKLREAIADEFQDADWNMRREEALVHADNAIFNAGDPPTAGERVGL